MDGRGGIHRANRAEAVILGLEARMDDVVDANNLLGQGDPLRLLPPDNPDPGMPAGRRGVVGEPAASRPAQHERPGWPERVAMLGDLARLLTEAGSREVLVRRALVLGDRLLGPGYSWRLLAVDAALEQRAVVIAGAGAGNMHAAATGPGVLGYGDDVDRRVLRKRQAVILDRGGEPRGGDLSSGAAPAHVYIRPLLDAGAILWGVLVVRVEVDGTWLERTDLTLAEAVGHTLATLLSRSGDADTPADPHVDPRVRDERHHDDHVRDDRESRDERDEFVSLAAHELRSPLTTVKGYAQLLLRAARKDPGASGNTQRALMAIEQQATRMSDMVAELLDASRIARGSFEVHPRLVVLDAIVRRAVDQHQSGLDRHQISLETEAAGLVGRWDGGRVEQVIRDLLDNALRFSPNGGAVRVHVSRVGDMARVSVSDTGIGVAADELDRVFELYYRGRDAQRRNLSGLGLGLFVSRVIAERMGGRLWLESGAGTGSTFTLELPVAAAGQRAPAERQGDSHDATALA